jgi:hypothetical protein
MIVPEAAVVAEAEAAAVVPAAAPVVPVVAAEKPQWQF